MFSREFILSGFFWAALGCFLVNSSAEESTCAIGDSYCNNLQKLKSQYSTFPYPPRERDSPVWSMPNLGLPVLSEKIYGGQRDWSQPFRFLNAGGGTGDVILWMALQFKALGDDHKAELVYLDLSPASLEIARARAEYYGVDHFITFLEGSLLDVNPETHGMFDLISCTGVLHHLASPEDGLRAFKQVLQPDGGLHIMVYGHLGRTGIYDVQNMIRPIKSGNDHEDVKLVRKLLEALPESTRIKANPNMWRGVQNGELKHDIGTYDMFLHSQDRSYTVPELYEWVTGADLALVSFCMPGMYKPQYYFPETTDPEILKRVAELPAADQHAYVELMKAGPATHSFYTMHADAVYQPLTIDKDSIPCRVYDFLPYYQMRQRSGNLFRASRMVTAHYGSDRVQVDFPSLINENRVYGNCKSTLEQLHQEGGGFDLTLEEFVEQTSKIYIFMTDFNDMAILRKGTTLYDTDRGNLLRKITD